MKIGLLGGSFNPPHNGHRHLAKTAYEKLCLDEVYVIPSYQTPGKAPFAKVKSEDRLQMTKLAFGDLPFCQVLSLEIDRKGISYTIDTVRELKKKECQIVILLAQDRVQTLGEWKDIDDLIKLASFAVMPRDEQSMPEGLQKIPLQMLQSPYLEISSTLIRQKLQKGQDCKDLLPAKVLDYIHTHGLYSHSLKDTF